MTRILSLAAAITVVGAGSTVDAGLISDWVTLDAILGPNAVNEDFESYVVSPGGTVTLATRFLDSTTIINGQGPGLVATGVTYISGIGVTGENFAWQGDGYFALSTKTLVAFMGPKGSMMMTIDYDTPVVAMGIDLFDYEGFSHTTTVSVFDPGGSLIESFDLFIDGPGGVFFGYEAAAIGSVTVTGNPLGWSSIIDNHTYGVPGPPTLALVAALGMAGRRRSRRGDITSRCGASSV